MISSSQDHVPVYLMLVQLLCLTAIGFLLCSDLHPGLHACDKPVNCMQQNGIRQWFKGTWPSLLHTQSLTDIWRQRDSYIKGGNTAVLSIGKLIRQQAACLCGLVKGKHANVTIMCLLLQLLVFIKRKTRVGLVSLISWIVLLLLYAWESYTHKAVRWKVPVVLACSLLVLCTTLYHILQLYVQWKGAGGEKQRWSGHYMPLSVDNTPSENCINGDACTQGLDTSHKAKTLEDGASEFHRNLRAMSLGSPALRQRSRDSSDHSGSFWNSSSNTSPQNSPWTADTPLVATRQRPLIVPAKLQYHSSPVKNLSTVNSVASRKWQESPRYYPSSDSEDEVLGGKSANGRHSRQSKRRSDNNLISTGAARPRPAQARACPSCVRSLAVRALTFTKTVFLLGISCAQTLLLLASLVLNCYLIAKHTDWLPRCWALLTRLRR